MCKIGRPFRHVPEWCSTAKEKYISVCESDPRSESEQASDIIPPDCVPTKSKAPFFFYAQFKESPLPISL